MKLTCYRLSADAPQLVPAHAARPWMDTSRDRFAYRCTPLSMANATGWELLCPQDIQADWNGGPGLGDLSILKDGRPAAEGCIATSHFGQGILTFHLGYLFRTEPGWAIWCRGAPNLPKDGILPLEGLVETDWLPFTFTMNWKFTRPGAVQFRRGEPFCFVTPVPHLSIEQIKPRILPLASNPDLAAEYQTWCQSRYAFNQSLAQRGDDAHDKWQRFYMTGKSPGAIAAPETHRTKRRMQDPEIVEQTEAPASATTTLAARKLIWIASYPKSGNTWVRIFLHNLLNELTESVTAPQDINRLSKYTAWEIPSIPYQEIIGKPMDEVSRQEIAAARPLVQERLARGRSGPFFVKTHLCRGNDYDVPTINTDVTLAAVYVVRNPLDVAISYSHHSSSKIDTTIRNLARRSLSSVMRDRHVYEILGSWSQHVGSWLGFSERPVHIMRYEDMVAAPTRTFGQLARFLRLQATDTQLESAIAKSSFDELKRQEEQNGFNEKPPQSERFFREGRVGQWKEVLTPQQIRRVIAGHAPMMQRFGYLPADCGGSILAQGAEDQHEELSLRHEA